MLGQPWASIPGSSWTLSLDLIIDCLYSLMQERNELENRTSRYIWECIGYFMSYMTEFVSVAPVHERWRWDLHFNPRLRPRCMVGGERSRGLGGWSPRPRSCVVMLAGLTRFGRNHWLGSFPIHSSIVRLNNDMWNPIIWEEEKIKQWGGWFHLGREGKSYRRETT